MQHSVQVDNSHPVTAVENHNRVAAEEDQSWQSEYSDANGPVTCHI